MALIDFEAKVAALHKRLETVGNFWVIRRDLSSEEVKQHPALLILATQYEANGGPGKAKDWTLSLSLKVYAKTLDTDPAPETAINGLVRQVLLALEWDPRNDPGNPLPYTTLGGTCARCQLAGPIRIEQGTGGGEAYAEIPVEIVSA